MKDVILSYRQASDLLISSRGIFYKSLVSIGDIGSELPTGYEDFPNPKIRFSFLDTETEQRGSVTPFHIQQLIGFLKRIEGPTIFHCQMGISRSAAACLIKIALQEDGRGYLQASRAVNHLLEIKKVVYPNGRMIEIADKLLGYNGDLVKVRESVFDLQ